MGVCCSSYTHHHTMTVSPAAAAIARLRKPQPTPLAAVPDTALPADFDPYQQQRIDFGNLITAWIHANGWSQETLPQIARAAGIRHFSVHNSQVSQLQRGLLQPKPKLFHCLAAVNALLADTSWQARTPLTTNLRARLHMAQPLTDEHGRPWDAVDFFAAFIGAVR